MAGYIGTTPVPQATQHRESFTATGGQTSFATAGYTPQFIDVYLNGVKLAPADYTATNGSDVVLASGATASDILEIVAYTPFEVASQTFTGDTTANNFAVTGTFTSRGIDDNADAVAITIDSSENVGIGTSTPRTGLHLYGAGQTNSAISDAGSLGAFLRVSDTGAAGGAGGGVIFGTNASEADGFAGFAAIKGLLANGNDRTIGALAFSTRAATTDTALTERMRLTSDGKLGIGTSSPSFNLHVAGNTYTNNITMPANGVTIGTDSLGSISGAAFQLFGTTSGNNIRAFTNGSERMRIDSSGNVLVGTTDTDPANNNVNGLAIGAANYFSMTRTNGSPMILNRKSSDGDIALFRKDGVTVGSIGSEGSGGTFFIGSGDVTLGFNAASDIIFPRGTNAANRTDAIDLGNANNRFKDLYLSGGVYLGGTGSANLLDDYEEGTFTPTAQGNTTSGTTTYAVDGRLGYYTKVGNCVHIVIRVQWTALTGTGVFTVENLPFTASSSTQNLSPLTAIPSALNWTSGTSFVGLMINNSTRIQFYGISDNGTAAAQQCVNESASLRISGFYFTDS